MPVKFLITILLIPFYVQLIHRRSSHVYENLKHNNLLHVICLWFVYLQVISILFSLYNFGRPCRASGRSQQQDSDGHGFWMVHSSSWRVHHPLWYPCSFMGTGYNREVSRKLNNLFTITYYLHATGGIRTPGIFSYWNCSNYWTTEALSCRLNPPPNIMMTLTISTGFLTYKRGGIMFN